MVNGEKCQVFDPLRRAYVAKTPEEEVRQQFVAFLMADRGYPPEMMANEVEVRLHGMRRRCDTVVYGKGLRPLMIVEYKRPQVPITEKVFAQICRYNLVMRVDYLVVSNGRDHYCCRMDYAHGTYAFLDDIPTYEQACAQQSPAQG